VRAKPQLHFKAKVKTAINLRKTCSVAPFPRPQRRERRLLAGAGRRRIIWDRLIACRAARCLLEMTPAACQSTDRCLDQHVIKLNFQPYLLQVQVLFLFIHFFDG